MKVSIVVPVYNSGKYIERCLDSILDSLGKTDGEILAIDNNSTDNSVKILKQYAKEHPAVKVLSCKTPGASAARNYGVKRAKGDYLWFVDSDDTIDKKAIRKLLKCAKKNQADFVMLGMKRIYPDGHEDYLYAINPKDTDAKHCFVRYGLGPMQVFSRRAWWSKHFKFKEGIIHEDMELMSTLILYTDNFAAVDKPLYYYYQNDGSVLHQKQWNPHAFDIFPALESLYKHFEDAKVLNEFHADIEWFFIWNLLLDSAKDFGAFPEGKPGFARSRAMLKKYFPNWRESRFFREKPFKLYLRVLLNYYGLHK